MNSTMTDHLRTYVERRLREIGANPFEAAREAGLERGFINDILQGKKRSVRGENLAKLASALQVPVGELIVHFSGKTISNELMKITGRLYSKSKDMPTDLITTNYDSYIENMDDIPVFNFIYKKSSHLIIDNVPLGKIGRPQMLWGVPSAYAIMAFDNFMAPEIEAEDLVLVHPKLPPKQNATCLFRGPGNGHEIGWLLRLVNITEDFWVAREWTTNDEIQLSREQWPTCHRSVGKFSG